MWRAKIISVLLAGLICSMPSIALLHEIEKGIPSREQVLSLVHKSPVRANESYQAWAELFDRDGWIKDPVGGPIYYKTPELHGYKPQSNHQLEKFYSVFISPNQIFFKQRSPDIVMGYKVIRDVTIESTTKHGLKVTTPVFLVYNTKFDSDGALKIDSMEAYWEFKKMIHQVKGHGFAGIRLMAEMGKGMVENMGICSSLETFAKNISGISKRGKKTVKSMVNILNINKDTKMSSLYHKVKAPSTGLTTREKNAEIMRGTLVDSYYYPDSLRHELADVLLTDGKSILVDKVLSAGFNTVFNFSLYSPGQATKTGVAFLEFDKASGKIKKQRFYLRF